MHFALAIVAVIAQKDKGRQLKTYLDENVPNKKLTDEKVTRRKIFG